MSLAHQRRGALRFNSGPWGHCRDTPYHGSDISLNVLLKPSVADAVNVKAQASGLSAEQWMSRIIEAAAQKR
jgi:predicted HicB family RNase H-like nuclease